MKQFILFSFIVVFLITSISCKKSNEKIESITEIQTEDNQKIDYDLSAMNYNMFSSITYDIMLTPDKYINKRMKIKGNFDSSIYENERYFSVLIWDPTGCCPTGMDFIPPENMKYPEDFPEKDTTITVIGILQFIEIEGQKYLTFNAEDVFWGK